MSINRVYIKKEKAIGKPDEKGYYTDHYTGEKVHYTQVQKGHLMYYEHKHLKDAAEHMNMSQRDFNKMNRNSDFLVPQGHKSNACHSFECSDKMVGYNTALNHIGKYLKYGKSEEEKKAIDKQLINARKEKLKEMKQNNEFCHKYDPNKTNIKSDLRESILIKTDRLNYEKMKSQLAKDRASKAHQSNSFKGSGVAKGTQLKHSEASISHKGSKSTMTSGSNKSQSPGKGHSASSS